MYSARVFVLCVFIVWWCYCCVSPKSEIFLVWVTCVVCVFSEVVFSVCLSATVFCLFVFNLGVLLLCGFETLGLMPP